MAVHVSGAVLFHVGIDAGFQLETVLEAHRTVVTIVTLVALAQLGALARLGALA